MRILFFALIILFPFCSFAQSGNINDSTGDSVNISVKPEIEFDSTSDSLNEREPLIESHVNYWGLVIGATRLDDDYIEVGFGWLDHKVVSHHYADKGIAFSVESTISRGEQIYAPKISAWISGGSAAMSMGLSLLEYRSSESKTLVLRPTIGIGIMGFRLVYGHNNMITKNEIEGIDGGQWSLHLLLDVF